MFGIFLLVVVYDKNFACNMGMKIDINSRQASGHVDMWTCPHQVLKATGEPESG
jgi:hypothetical protein